MAESPFDRVTVEAYGRPGSTFSDFNFDAWTSFALSNSIVSPAEAAFELGDVTGWDRMEELVGLGAQFRVFVDDRLRLTGRVEQLTSTSDARQSATQRFCVRTKLSDAIVSSAPQNVRMQNRTVREFLLALYADIGLVEGDFDFRGDVSRDLMTGRITRGADSKGKRRSVDGRPLADPLPGFEALDATDAEAKAQPTESLFDCAARHLRRHGLMHWDGPDGRIVVAAPNDQQEPSGVLRMLRGSGPGDAQFNNVLSAERDQDVSKAPTVLGLFGTGGKASFARSKVSATVRNDDLIARGFKRRIGIFDEGVTTKALATRRAAHEFAQRNRGLDRFTILVDGLSYRDGVDPVPWAHDTTVDLIVEELGGAVGLYYVEDVQMTRDATNGDATKLSVVKQGVWQL